MVKKKSSDPVRLPFKSSEAAFEYICRYMNCEIVVDSGLPALVLDGKIELNLEKSVSIQDNGLQTAVLRVPSKDGGFITIAETVAPGPLLKPGDLVVWVPGIFLDELAEQVEDKRFGWVGLIAGILEPVWDSSIGWKGKHKFG